LRAESNLVLGLLVEAADLPSGDLLPPVRDRFTAAAGRLAKATKALANAEISKLAADMVAIGKRDDNMFALKAKEFADAVVGANVLTENGRWRKRWRIRSRRSARRPKPPPPPRSAGLNPRSAAARSSSSVWRWSASPRPSGWAGSYVGRVSCDGSPAYSTACIASRKATSTPRS